MTITSIMCSDTYLNWFSINEAIENMVTINGNAGDVVSATEGEDTRFHS